MALGSYFYGRPRSSQAVLYAVFLIVAVVVLSTILTISFAWLHMWYSMLFGKKVDWDSLCTQLPSIDPPGKFSDASQFLSESYKLESAELLGGAVRVPTESFDDMNPDPKKDKRFNIFKKLHSYLEESFPEVSKNLEHVNTYGLLYTLEGKNPDLEPIVLMAHQDVVPVERQTLDKWTHGAFSGYFDGQYIWGRGAHDTKSSLIAILEATESLLSQDWQPERTTLISFGFDEELDGSRGAKSLADVIRERYGAVYMIIDEGSGVEVMKGHTFAFVSVSEKGYTDINIRLDTPGGHSSAPPDHTGIGILSELLAKLETSHIANTEYYLNSDDIVAEMYSCVAKYGEDIGGNERSKLVDVEYLRETLKSNRYERPYISTTQAIDVINGGVKLNALPEQVTAIVNHRIDVHETVAEVTDRIVELAKAVAKEHQLGLNLNGKMLLTGESGTFDITNGQSMEPAPISPFSTDSEHWKLLVGTTKHALGAWFDLTDVTVTPTLSVGNTDTWQSAGLTKNVYRYTVGTPNSGGHAHTVDEYISLESHLAALVWYYEMMQFF